MINPDKYRTTLSKVFEDGMMRVTHTTDNVSSGGGEQNTLFFESLASSECFAVEQTDSTLKITITGAWEAAGIIEGLKQVLA